MVWQLRNPDNAEPSCRLPLHKEEEEEEWRCIYLWGEYRTPTTLRPILDTQNARGWKRAFYYGPKRKTNRPTLIYHTEKEIFYYQMSITYFTNEGYWARRKSPQGFYKTGNSETGFFKVAFLFLFLFIFFGSSGRQAGIDLKYVAKGVENS